MESGLTFSRPLSLDGGLPEWLTLVPAGAEVRGRDGRTFRSPGAQALLRAHAGEDLMIPVDVNHASELVAQAGQDTPAYGWVVELKADPHGALLGRVEWNDRGQRALNAKDYRYYSPTFDLLPPNTIDIVTSVALVNRPNLYQRALNHRGGNMDATKIASLLGLSGQPTDAEIEAALAARVPKADLDRAMQRAQTAEQKLQEADKPPAAWQAPDGTVPKADLDRAMQRAQTAEQKLQEAEAAQQQAAADAVKRDAEAVFAEGVEKGVFAPATKDYHLSRVQNAEDVKKFREFMTASPAVVGGGKRQARQGEQPPAAPADGTGEGETAPSAELEEVRRQMLGEEAAKGDGPQAGDKAVLGALARALNAAAGGA